MIQEKNSSKSYLQRISNTLMINGSFLDNCGLYTGEMGIVLFFSRYARFIKNELYADYSFELLEKVQNSVYQDTPIDYKFGLAGFGSTIEYLVQYNFFEADTDDILEEFDNRIFFTYNLPYLPIDQIMDIGYYVIWRLSGKSSRKDMIRQTILPPIVKAMSEWNKKNNLPPHPVVSFFKEIVSNTKSSIIPAWLELCRKHSPYRLNAKSHESLLENFSNSDNTNIKNLNLGIQNGLAGLGLSLLTELDGDDTWISLFPNELIPIKK